jgi:hypothetical protein
MVDWEAWVNTYIKAAAERRHREDGVFSYMVKAIREGTPIDVNRIMSDLSSSEDAGEAAFAPGQTGAADRVAGDPIIASEATPERAE